MGRIETDIALESWLFGFRPCLGQGQFTQLPGGASLHVRTCRDTPHIALLYLRNGMTDCVQI